MYLIGYKFCYSDQSYHWSTVKVPECVRFWHENVHLSAYHNLGFLTLWLAENVHFHDKIVHIRVGHSRRFVHVAPKSIHLGPTSPWKTEFVKLYLGNHLHLGLKVL